MRLKSIPLRDPEIVEAEARTYWRGNAEKGPDNVANVADGVRASN